MWTIDRERSVFDELVNLLDAKSPLPAVAHATYSAIVSKHMDLLAFRSAASSSSAFNLVRTQQGKSIPKMATQVDQRL